MGLQGLIVIKKTATTQSVAKRSTDNQILNTVMGSCSLIKDTQYSPVKHQLTVMLRKNLIVLNLTKKERKKDTQITKHS